MFSRVAVVGRGRAGSALAARLGERALLEPETHRADLVVLAVPDAAIRSVAQSIPSGPWLAHVSGATPLAALDPHRTRFSVHPLQTLVRSRGPEQLDGAWGGLGAESPDGLARARWLAGVLGLRPFELADAHRATYHAGAMMASSFVVTLFRAASRAVATAGAPPEALVPLIRRTIENDFELTGPISRGDLHVIEAHLAALERDAPDLVALYRVLVGATSR